MPYLYRMRQWGIKNAPSLGKVINDSNLGVLSHMQKEPLNSDQHEDLLRHPKKYMDKLHSLFFPYTWQEAIVQPERLLLANGKMNNTEQMQYWNERISVFKEDEIPTAVNKDGKVVNTEQQLEQKERLEQLRYEYFNEVTSTIVELGMSTIMSPT